MFRGHIDSLTPQPPLSYSRQPAASATSPHMITIHDSWETNGTAENVLNKSTRATQVLADAGVAFTVHSYDYDPNAERVGLQAADALGVQPWRVLKTLMAYVDRKPVCVILPSDREVALKKLAAAVNGKSAQMMPPADAERIAGYKIGGISPFGQKRHVPTVLEQQALGNDWVFVNAGLRGLQIRLEPQVIVQVLDAKVAPISG